MEKYNWLLKKQSKALAVFEQARAQLASLQQHFLSAIGEANDAIDDHEEQIAEQKKAIEFLTKQHQGVTEQHFKISNILGG